MHSKRNSFKVHNPICAVAANKAVRIWVSTANVKQHALCIMRAVSKLVLLASLYSLHYLNDGTTNDFSNLTDQSDDESNIGIIIIFFYIRENKHFTGQVPFTLDCYSLLRMIKINDVRICRMIFASATTHYLHRRQFIDFFMFCKLILKSKIFISGSLTIFLRNLVCNRDGNGRNRHLSITAVAFPHTYLKDFY